MISNLKHNPAFFQRNSSKRKRKFSCGICKNGVNSNHRVVFCDKCNYWIHIKCNGATPKEYDRLIHEPGDIPWFCIVCTIMERADQFPFEVEPNIELLTCMVLTYPLW